MEIFKAGCNVIELGKLEFVVNAQFLSKISICNPTETRRLYKSLLHPPLNNRTGGRSRNLDASQNKFFLIEKNNNK